MSPHSFPLSDASYDALQALAQKYDQRAVSILETRGSCHKATYRVERISDQSQFVAMQAEWDGFLDRIGETAPWFRHGWVSAYLQHFPPDQLCILLCYDAAEELAALFPLQISRPRRGLFLKGLRRLSWIGMDPCVMDACHTLLRPEVDRVAVFSQVAKMLQAPSTRWDMVAFPCLDRLEDVQDWERMLIPLCARVEWGRDSEIPYRLLPETLAAYEVLPRKRKYRQSLHKAAQLLQKTFSVAAPALQEFTFATHGLAPFEAFLSRYQATWKQRGVRTDFARFEALADFWKTIYQRSAVSEAVLCALCAGDTPLSYEFGLRTPTTHFGVLMVDDARYRPMMPGFLRFEAMLPRAIESGRRHFFFGRGGQRYKSTWADQSIAVYSLQAFRSQLAWRGFQADEGLKKILGRGVSSSAPES